MARNWKTSLTILALGVASGCALCGPRQGANARFAPSPRPVLMQPQPQPVPLATMPVAPVAPAFPMVPQNQPQAASMFVPGTVAPAPNPMPIPATPRIEANWQPAEARANLGGGVQLAAPVIPPHRQTESSVKLYPPVITEERDPSPEPPLAARSTPRTTLPVGIPQFANARDNLSAGLRPSLDDGLDWLQTNGYRTVVQLRAPGDDDTIDRRQAEKRGLTYLGIEINPATLTIEKASEFLALTRDPSRLPMFVYDRDGSLAGPLWYLYFRRIENLPEDAARLRANNLGLREDRDGMFRAMWLAVQLLPADNTR